MSLLDYNAVYRSLTDKDDVHIHPIGYVDKMLKALLHNVMTEYLQDIIYTFACGDYPRRDEAVHAIDKMIRLIEDYEWVATVPI